MKKQGRSIFHTIFLAMLSVLFIETLLLLIVLYLSRVGEQLNQNAIDLLQKQVENRSSYLESVMLDIMYQLPSMPGVKECVINDAVIDKKAPPLYIYDTEAHIAS